MKHCPIHNIDYQGTIGNGSFKIDRPCPRCEEELEKQEKAKAEEEQRRAQIQTYTKMNIEPEFYNATLESYIAETAEQMVAVRAIKRLVLGEIKKLVMLGTNGTGKTHLAIAAVKELGGAIYSMSEILVRIRDSYSPFSSETEGAIRAELIKLPLLAIDELGRTKGSDAEINTLSYIVDKRHQKLLPLILISNRHSSNDCQRGGCPECFENYIGEDSMSRLVQDGLLLRLSGSDWRKSHKSKISINNRMAHQKKRTAKRTAK